MSKLFPTVHEDTLAALEFVFSSMEEREWTRERNLRWDGDDCYSCTGCASHPENYFGKDTEFKHEEGCSYVKHMAVLKAFIEIEQKLHNEQE